MPKGAPEIRLDSRPETTTDVMRFDLARISPNVTRTPQGFLKAPAFVTKAGVFEYRRADGKTVRELRPEEEVFHEDSLATIANAPITRDHPKAGYVTPDNARELSIGHLTESVSRSDTRVATTAIVSDAAAIKDVHSGDLREFSMGYKCNVEWTAGEHPKFGRYDCIQRNIRYNHAAMGGQSWGRAGEDIALRMDSEDAVQRADAMTALEHYVRQQMDLKGLRETDAPFEGFGLMMILGGFEPTKRSDLAKLAAWLGVDVDTLIALVPESERADSNPEHGRKPMDEIKLTIGGVEFTVPKAAGQAFQAEMTRKDSRIAELEADAEKAQGRFDAQAEELKKANEKVTELEDGSRLDSAVNERVELISKAKTVLGADADVKGTKREIMETVLKKDNADLDLSKRSDDYVEARFDSLVESWDGDKANSSSLDANRRAAHDASKGGGGDDRHDSKAAHQRFTERSRDAWKQPLAVSKA